jgi:hypothetical protein
LDERVTSFLHLGPELLSNVARILFWLEIIVVSVQREGSGTSLYMDTHTVYVSTTKNYTDLCCIVFYIVNFVGYCTEMVPNYMGMLLSYKSPYQTLL